MTDVLGMLLKWRYLKNFAFLTAAEYKVHRQREKSFKNPSPGGRKGSQGNNRFPGEEVG